jgi:hypothetical protein
MADGNWSLITPFLTDDPVFAAGVEFDLLFRRLRDGEKLVKEYIQRKNQDRVLVMAGRLGYEIVRQNPWDKNWLYIEMRKK